MGIALRQVVEIRDRGCLHLNVFFAFLCAFDLCRPPRRVLKVRGCVLFPVSDSSTFKDSRTPAWYRHARDSVVIADDTAYCRNSYLGTPPQFWLRRWRLGEPISF